LTRSLGLLLVSLSTAFTLHPVDTGTARQDVQRARMTAQEPTRHSSPDYDDSGFSLSQLASFDAPPPPPLAASPPSARLATPLPSTPPPISGVHLEDLAFPLDDDWENDLHSSPLKPRPSSPSPEDEKPLLELNPPPTAPPLGWAPRSWCRCTVKEVREDQVDEHGWYAKVS
jgi:hypothetical protein